MEQRDLFDEELQQEIPNHVAVTQATESGIATAEIKLGRARGQEFVERGLEAIRRIAAETDTLTADDVWAIIGSEFSEFGSQMGPVFRSAQKLGLIEFDGTFKESTRASRHRSAVRVWRSRLS